MNQFPYLYPHSLSEAERLNEEELWQDNRDAEVSHTQLTEMFRHSDPAALMDEAEQAQLAELDDTVTVYRGVTTINSDNLLALSWTLDYETADWFARRFDEDGTVYKAQIDKEHIFALFNGRDESEVVLDPKYLKDITQAQEPNSTHVSLYVGLGRVAEGCYHLALAAKSYGRCVEAIKFYLALKHAGLPVIIYGAEFIKKRLLGLERVGIVPNEVMPFYSE